MSRKGIKLPTPAELAARREKVRQFTAEGLTRREIAERIGTSVGIVGDDQRWLRLAPVRRRVAPRRPVEQPPESMTPAAVERLAKRLERVHGEQATRRKAAIDAAQAAIHAEAAKRFRGAA